MHFLECWCYCTLAYSRTHMIVTKRDFLQNGDSFGGRPHVDAPRFGRLMDSGVEILDPLRFLARGFRKRRLKAVSVCPVA